MLKKIKSYMMPIAMTLGILFYEPLSKLGFITPGLVAVMLFISYSVISLKDVRISKLHLLLAGIQLLGSWLAYQALLPVNPTIAQGVMICILAPTATSAIVITGMLGGNTSSLAAYSLLCNMCAVVFAPLMFVMLGYESDIPFWQAFLLIFGQVFPILLAPFAASLALQKFFPAAYFALRRMQSVSFYLWGVALTIVTARTVNFILAQEPSGYQTELSIAGLSLLACGLQFFTGKQLGRRYNDTIAGGQGLGQKNTVLAIWMAQTFMNPISSIGPGAYVLWQNLFNSWQVWRMGRK
ncbi:MAG: bile acid:sodium symporter [Prevotella sp.]|jgi:BASS family bile acid:Na+ symporter|nr:bile acid:sodium symporter [Prevotella sp.]